MGSIMEGRNIMGLHYGSNIKAGPYYLKIAPDSSLVLLGPKNIRHRCDSSITKFPSLCCESNEMKSNNPAAYGAQLDDNGGIRPYRVLTVFCPLWTKLEYCVLGGDLF